MLIETDAAHHGKRRKRIDWNWKTITACVALCATVIALFLFFSVMLVPKMQSIMLFPRPDYETGWSYYDEDGNAHSEIYGEDGYFSGIEGFSGTSIAAWRVMKETLPQAVLKFESVGQQVSVYLDDALLYTDIKGTPENGAVFWAPEEATFESRRDKLNTVYISLPEDYTGKTLTVFTYLSNEGMEGFGSLYPQLFNDQTIAAVPVADTAKTSVPAGAFATAAVLLLALLAYRAFAGIPEWRVAWLAVFFLGAMVNVLYASPLAIYATGDDLFLFVVSSLYIDFLLLFFASYMRKVFRNILMCAIGAHIVLFVLHSAINAANGVSYDMGRNGWLLFGLMMLFCAFCLAEWKRKEYMFRAVGVCVAAFGAVFAVLLVLYVLNTGSELAQAAWTPFSSLLYGRAVGFNTAFSNFIAIAGVAAVLTDFIKAAARATTQKNALSMRYEMAMNTLHDTREQMRRTNEMRHEIRHHLLAMQTFLQGKSIAQAEDYVEALLKEIERPDAVQYTENPIVNAILNAEFARAKNEGISVEANVAVQEEISIEDKDLVSLLSNMLDNAIEASSNVLQEKERIIELKMRTNGRFLSISCKNAMSGSVKVDQRGEIVTTKGENQNHGYGLAVMQKICKKYTSILVIDYGDRFFSVKTNLRMPE